MTAYTDLSAVVVHRCLPLIGNATTAAEATS